MRIKEKENKMLELTLSLLEKQTKIDTSQINGFLTMIGLGVAIGIVLRQHRLSRYEWELDETIANLQKDLDKVAKK